MSSEQWEAEIDSHNQAVADAAFDVYACRLNLDAAEEALDQRIRERVDAIAAFLAAEGEAADG